MVLLRSGDEQRGTERYVDSPRGSFNEACIDSSNQSRQSYRPASDIFVSRIHPETPSSDPLVPHRTLREVLLCSSCMGYDLKQRQSIDSLTRRHSTARDLKVVEILQSSLIDSWCPSVPLTCYTLMITAGTDMKVVYSYAFEKHT